MDEAETRAELIDPLLAVAGWGVVEGSRIRREVAITPGRIEGGGRRGKSLAADYVLVYRNTLADQALRDFTGFAAFEDNALVWPLPARFIRLHRDR